MKALWANLRLTQRALDAGDSAAFSSIFLASSFFCSQADSTSAPAPVTPTVGQAAGFEGFEMKDF